MAFYEMSDIFSRDLSASCLILKQPVQLAQPGNSAQVVWSVKPVKAFPFDKTKKSYPTYSIYVTVGQKSVLLISITNYKYLYSEIFATVHHSDSSLWCVGSQCL